MKVLDLMLAMFVCMHMMVFLVGLNVVLILMAKLLVTVVVRLYHYLVMVVLSL